MNIRFNPAQLQHSTLSIHTICLQVADIMIVDHGCHDPAAVTAAVLADVAQTKEAEAEIRQRLGAKTVKVWREVKLFLDHKTCQVVTSSILTSLLTSVCRTRATRSLARTRRSARTRTASWRGSEVGISPSAPTSRWPAGAASWRGWLQRWALKC